MKYHVPIAPVLRITTLNTCSLFYMDRPYNFQREFHPFWELIYVVDGSLRVACQERVYTLKQGDLIFHRPMELHRLWSAEDCCFEVLVVGFCAEGTLLSRLKDTAFELTGQQQSQLAGIISQLRQNFPGTKHQFLRHASEDPSAYAPQLQMFASALEVFLIALLHKPELPQPKPRSLSHSAQLYGRIVEALNGSPDGWITSAEIARQLHCSESQIKQTFARYSDMGIHKYLIRLKIAAAIELLQQGCSVNETGRRLGFANQNYFSTVFKRETGLPPSHYAGKKPV